MPKKQLSKEQAPKGRRQADQATCSPYLSALGDMLVTALWVVISCTFPGAAEQLAEASGLSEFTLIVAITIAGLALLAPLCSLFWGACINPANSATLLLAGRGATYHHLLRMACQVAGAVLGASAATKVIPAFYQRKFHLLPGGLQKGVPLHIGFSCEALLGALMNLIFLFSLDACNKQLAFWTSLLSTVGLIYTGSFFTGPSLNPGMAFGWNYHYQLHSVEEHAIVFWLAPLVGAAAAAFSYPYLRQCMGCWQPAKRRSKAKKSKQAQAAAPASAKPPAPAAADAAAADAGGRLRPASALKANSNHNKHCGLNGQPAGHANGVHARQQGVISSQGPNASLSGEQAVEGSTLANGVAQQSGSSKAKKSKGAGKAAATPAAATAAASVAHVATAAAANGNADRKQSKSGKKASNKKMKLLGAVAGGSAAPAAAADHDDGGGWIVYSGSTKPKNKDSKHTKKKV